MPSGNINVSLSEYQGLKEKITTAVDNWSSGLFLALTPFNLFSKSVINEISDESAYTIVATFYYGERNGTLAQIPYDQSSVKKIQLAEESLWLYASGEKYKTPEGFKKVKQPWFYIATGDTHHCHRCSGRGRVKCNVCYGRGMVKRRRDDHDVWEPCRNCSGGWVECSTCSGFGWTQTVIKTTTQYRATTISDVEYTGSISKENLLAAEGERLFARNFNYPIDKLTDMLTGGIDEEEFRTLQNSLIDAIHATIDKELSNYEGNLQVVHDHVETFMQEIPNPVKENKLLEHEIIPVRMKIEVSKVTSYLVSYTYKENNYQLSVYGKEKKVDSPDGPSEFTPKVVIILGIILLVFGLIYFLGYQ